MSWQAVGDGTTVGTRGPEGGIIAIEEEHPSGARIALEEDGQIAPWSITCGVYWLFFHTRFFADRATAEAEYAAMKSALDALISRLSAADLDEQLRLAGEFVDRFP